MTLLLALNRVKEKVTYSISSVPKWDGITLGEFVYLLVSSKRTESDEFKSLVNIYGHKKIQDLYLSERNKHKDDAL